MNRDAVLPGWTVFRWADVAGNPDRTIDPIAGWQWGSSQGHTRGDRCLYVMTAARGIVLWIAWPVCAYSRSLSARRGRAPPADQGDFVIRGPHYPAGWSETTRTPWHEIGEKGLKDL
jgi:hypothetical protein